MTEDEHVCDYMLTAFINLTMTYFFTGEDESDSRTGKCKRGGSRFVGGGSQSVVVICHST